MPKSNEQSKVIGKNIKAARAIRGLSQRDLAEKLGIAFQNLSVWENGKGSPSAQYLIKLSEVLNFSLDQLTSADGVRANLESSISNQEGLDAQPAADSELQDFFDSELPRIIRQELFDNSDLRTIIQQIEEVLRLLKSENADLPGDTASGGQKG